VLESGHVGRITRWAGSAYPREGPGGWPEPVTRPGTIVAAATLTWVSVVCSIFVTLLALVMVLWLGSGILDAFSGPDDHPRRYVIGGAAVLVMWSLVAAWLAWQVMRRRRWARWALAVSALVTVVVSTLSVTLVVTAGPLIAGVGVLVLLFTGGANDWFREMRNKSPTEPVRHNARHA